MLFKAEDFYDLMSPVYGGRSMSKDFADFCNRILLERGVRVYGETKDGFFWHRVGPAIADKKQGLLVCIEELPKKECEHKPEKYIMEGQVLTGGFCHCGVKLKAKWDAE